MVTNIYTCLDQLAIGIRLLHAAVNGTWRTFVLLQQLPNSIGRRAMKTAEVMDDNKAHALAAASIRDRATATGVSQRARKPVHVR
jgi:hypothetical protein